MKRKLLKLYAGVAVLVFSVTAFAPSLVYNETSRNKVQAIFDRSELATTTKAAAWFIAAAISAAIWPVQVAGILFQASSGDTKE